MKKILITVGLAGALVVPAQAAANPDASETSAARQQCKAERGKSKATREAFQAKYLAFGRCARQNAVEEDAENEAAHRNAAKACKAERAADAEAFAQKYGTNKNGKNAFGKCVSSQAKAQKDELDAEDAKEVAEFKNAAKECAAERSESGDEAFRKEYGTNVNGRNAFGKCVSRKTSEEESAS